MSNNVYGIDLGTNNFKVYSKATGKTMLEKNTIAVIDKNQIYAYGDSAYAMYEKAPETINVIFPVVEANLIVNTGIVKNTLCQCSLTSINMSHNTDISGSL